MLFAGARKFITGTGRSAGREKEHRNIDGEKVHDLGVSNNCTYCIYSHTASAFRKGMTDAMFKELQAVIGMANETNKLVTGYQVEVDEQFKGPLSRTRP